MGYSLEEIGRENAAPKKAEENFIAGIVGAFLFSLAGVVVWFAVYQLGFIAGIAGIVTVVCAIQGYGVFGKVASPKGLIASLLISVAMIFIAEYICIGYEIYVAYKPQYDITIFDALRAVDDFLQEEEIRNSFIYDLALGYGFTLLGSIRSIIGVVSSLRKRRKQEAAGL
jgi:hypothetical protein